MGLMLGAGRFLPGAAAAAIAGATFSGRVRPPLLGPVAGALLLLAYGATAAAAGSVATVRRDIG